MKIFKKSFIGLFVVALAVLLVTGCEPKREALKFDGEEGTLTFNVKADQGYKISTDKEDLRNSREQGALVGKDFKISIEFDDDYGYFFDGDLEKLKEKRKDNDEYKEVEYSNIKGIQYFYGGYNSYTIYLPIEGDKENILVLSVYGKEDKEEAAKTAIESEEVQDVLNHISDIAAKK